MEGRRRFLLSVAGSRRFDASTALLWEEGCWISVEDHMSQDDGDAWAGWDANFVEAKLRGEKRHRVLRSSQGHRRGYLIPLALEG